VTVCRQVSGIGTFSPVLRTAVRSVDDSSQHPRQSRQDPPVPQPRHASLRSRHLSQPPDVVSLEPRSATRVPQRIILLQLPVCFPRVHSRSRPARFPTPRDCFHPHSASPIPIPGLRIRLYQLGCCRLHTSIWFSFQPHSFPSLFPSILHPSHVIDAS
jgi:hypothetical protein